MPQGYLPGTEIQEKSGRIKLKISQNEDGAKWISKARYEFMKQRKVDLESNQRVYFLDGNPTNFHKDNLAAITFSGISYRIKTSKVLYEPKKPIVLKQYTPNKIKVYV